jgi:hypothetical protein
MRIPVNGYSRSLLNCNNDQNKSLPTFSRLWIDKPNHLRTADAEIPSPPTSQSWKIHFLLLKPSYTVYFSPPTGGVFISILSTVVVAPRSFASQTDAIQNWTCALPPLKWIALTWQGRLIQVCQSLATKNPQ